MKYNLRHKIKEIVLGNNSKATLETPKLVGSATKSIRSCRGHHRPRSQTDALAVMSVWTSMVSRLAGVRRSRIWLLIHIDQGLWVENWPRITVSSHNLPTRIYEYSPQARTSRSLCPQTVS